MESGSNFEEFWKLLKSSLKNGEVIPHWSLHRPQEKTFIVDNIYENKIEITNSKNRKRVISKTDFENIFSKWDSYKQGGITRKELRDIPNQNTTYVISIIYKLKVN